MYWKCLFVFKNTCIVTKTTLWLLAVISASILCLCTLFVSLYLPICVYDDAVAKEQHHFNFEMLESSFSSSFPHDLIREKLIEKLQRNITKLTKELQQVRATVGIYEKLGKVMEKDSSLLTFGNKRHQNILITSVPDSGEILLGELFNQHRDVFFLFEPFHSLKYFRENRSPEIYASILDEFLQGIFSCDFSQSIFYTEFLSRHYRALLHRFASRTLSTPPLCPEAIYGRHYNIRNCTHLRPPTLNAICKLHEYTAVKTTQITDLEKLMELEDGRHGYFRVLELVRDPRAIAYTKIHETTKSNATEITEGWVTSEARKICTQQLRNRKYRKNLAATQTNRFIMIKYEDLIAGESKFFENICDLLGLSSSRHSSSWFTGVLKDGFTWPTVLKDGGMSTKGSRIKINLTSSVSEWKTGLQLWQIRLIERECFEVMKILGYIFLNN